jgi:hypothetical protein
MDKRVNHAAHAERDPPVKYAPQAAENSAAKQNFLNRADNRGGGNRAGNRIPTILCAVKFWPIPRAPQPMAIPAMTASEKKPSASPPKSFLNWP